MRERTFLVVRTWLRKCSKSEQKLKTTNVTSPNGFFMFPLLILCMDMVLFLSGEICNLMEEINKDLLSFDLPEQHIARRHAKQHIDLRRPKEFHNIASEDEIYPSKQSKPSMSAPGSSMPLVQVYDPENSTPVPHLEAKKTTKKSITYQKPEKTPKTDVHWTPGRPHTEEDRHLKSKFTLRVSAALLRDFKDVCHELGVHCNEIITIHMREDVHKHKQKKSINSLKIKSLN